MKVRHKEIKRWLYNKFKLIIDDYKNSEQKINVKVIDDSCPIWYCWLQGEDNMPETIKICYDSIARNKGNRPLIFISDNNISHYTTIPDFIQKKRERGIISRTHFSDYLRCKLLKEHGGLWIDAAIYANTPLSMDIGRTFFTGKEQPTQSKQFVSNYAWLVGIISSPRNGLLPTILVYMFEEYLKLYNTYIDYYLFDYFVAICYDEVELIHQQINNNSMLITNKFIKLPWKIKHDKIDKDGKETFYGKICREYYLRNQ